MKGRGGQPWSGLGPSLLLLPHLTRPDSPHGLGPPPPARPPPPSHYKGPEGWRSQQQTTALWRGGRKYSYPSLCFSAVRGRYGAHPAPSTSAAHPPCRRSAI
ncbi:hypothetical protein E2C01_015332 [Portunus trituberculatus]|uniref:Uncharacterized protein n=1 Tax=Portunus trituberculatus TaxID=210409 RepID=A0A5B7DL95_PORTR|nr:hypothetical protein [Portunus trituberculatus]